MQEDKIVKRIPTNLITKVISTSSAEYEPNKEYTDEDANVYEKYLQAITNVSIDINSDIEKIKALEDNILEQYNKNAELEKKMEQETEKFVEQANTAIQDYNSNVETKTEEFNTNAKKKTNEFDSNAIEKKSEINDIAEGVKNMATAIQFANFKINKGNMHLQIITTKKLGNTSFTLNKKNGRLGVRIVNGN